jgi:hypothetical protein
VSIKLIAFTFVALATSVAFASSGLPPVEYDHPYNGKLLFEIVTLEQLRIQCRNAPQSARACAYSGAGSCRVFMASDVRGWQAKLLMRHEIGHCRQPAVRFPVPLDSVQGCRPAHFTRAASVVGLVISAGHTGAATQR